jgi:hypothetical protein
MPGTTIADHIIRFNRELTFSGQLPDGIRIMNPFRENAEVMVFTERFYRKFYNDSSPRRMILGINPGRLGAGATGIPFTDSKRLREDCGIDPGTVNTHEMSSVFVYEMIKAYGGPELFYSRYLISAMCPLGFVRINERNNLVNYNYYDSEALFRMMKPAMVDWLREQLTFGIDTGTCFILGKKNAGYFAEINAQEKFFSEMIVLDHPRFIMQYRLKKMDEYIGRYIEALEIPSLRQ